MKRLQARNRFGSRVGDWTESLYSGKVFSIQGEATRMLRIRYRNVMQSLLVLFSRTIDSKKVGQLGPAFF